MASSDSGQAGNSQGGSDVSGVTAQESMLPGKLYFFNLEDRDPSILRGVTISGNCAGSLEFNSKEKGTDGIRCIFELSEWVEFYPDTDAEYGIKVWILKHQEDQSIYETTKFSDLMPGFCNYCDLHKDEDNEDATWGSFYLNYEEFQPGYYDFVFVYDGKAIAKMITYFYANDALSGKSDAELEKLTSGLSAN